MKHHSEGILITAGGKIACRRCKAVSGRTTQQCGRPAIRGKAVCQFHGGRSTGPKLEHAKKRLKTLHLVHGQYTKEHRLAFAEQNLTLRYLEDVGVHVGLLPSKTRGRKPHGYLRLNANVLDDYVRLLELAGILGSSS